MPEQILPANQTAHTPGPWRWYGTKALEAQSETVLVGDCGKPSCGRTHLFVSEANARLIAVAPELLTALKQMTDRFEKCLKAHGTDPEYAAIAVESARAAIAKAEGR